MPAAPKVPFEKLSAFEQRIRLLEEDRGKPRSLMAREHLSKDTVSNWCRKAANGHPPQINQQIQAFADELGVTTSWLLDPTPLDRNAKVPGVADSTGKTPTTSIDTRKIIDAALRAAGIESGIAASAALHVEFRGLEDLPRALGSQIELERARLRTSEIGDGYVKKTAKRIRARGRKHASE
jgi:hypothetical protein